MSNCEESVGKYYGHLLSDQLIVFVEMQNFKDNVLPKSIILMVLSSNYGVYKFYA
jgi:hypothetical protein